MFFSFDGIDGSGKSTQMDLFCQWLIDDHQREVIRCREPGGTPLGEKVRDILLNQKNIQLEMETEMLLFMASRAQLVREVIRPALNKGKVVVCDRFLLASVVYQGHAGGISPQVIREVGKIATGNTHPDMTFVFHLDPAVAATRVGDATDRIESRDEEFLQKVDAGFRQEVQQGGAAMKSIDGADSIDSIQRQIQSTTEALFEKVRNH